MNTYSTRVRNFSAGPSILPEPVLQQAARDLVCHPALGASVMEVSHRCAFWVETMHTIEANLRSLASIPDDYAVLFTSGGASTQFATTPLNLIAPDQTADVIDTGRWTQRAIDELKRLKRHAHIVASSAETNYDRLPDESTYSFSEHGQYVHYASNNTIYGTQFHTIPNVGDRLLVCDASSDIFSRPIDISKFGVVFAGAQKNLGPAGTTLIIVRRDLLDRITWTVPTMLTWKTLAVKGSMYNTPPVWPIYILGLVVEWLHAQGGLSVMDERNAKKSALLYNALDASDLFVPVVQAADRSRMNVTFRIREDSKASEADFIAQAEQAGLRFLKGHRSVGGMRASLYNAMPYEGVEDLVAFMQSFEQRNG